jgi:hypothetical protein
MAKKKSQKNKNAPLPSATRAPQADKDQANKQKAWK